MIRLVFAVMLTQAKNAPTRLVFQTQAIPAAIAALALAVIIALTVTATDWGEAGGTIATATDAQGNTSEFSFALLQSLAIIADTYSNHNGPHNVSIIIKN